MDNWKLIGQDIIGEANGDEFGYSVSILEGGKTIAVGGRLDNGINGVDSGHVRISSVDKKFERDVNGKVSFDESGYSVSLSADGSTIAIGVTFNDNNGAGSGQVTVYRFNGC